MDPAIGGIFIAITTIATAVLAYINYKRGKRDRVEQSQADEMRTSIDHPSRDGDKLFLGKPKT